MSYPPDASRSCHEADGRSDRSGGSGGGTITSGPSVGCGGPYGAARNSGFIGKWSQANPCVEQQGCVSVAAHDRAINNWKKWSLGLDSLLQDSEGVSLFKNYLHSEGCANLLDFWFACQGFRSKVDPSDSRKIIQLIRAIYRTYIRSSSCSGIGLSSTPPSSLLGESQPPVLIQQRTEPIRLRAETKRQITERISHKQSLDQTVFDSAQSEVEHFLRTTAYPAFLKSDVYIDFLQNALDATSRKLPVHACSTVTTATPTFVSTCAGGSNVTHTYNVNIPDYSIGFPLSGKLLPTLEEDRELRSEEIPWGYSSDQSSLIQFKPGLRCTNSGDTLVPSSIASITTASSAARPHLPFRHHYHYPCQRCLQYHPMQPYSVVKMLQPDVIADSQQPPNFRPTLCPMNSSAPLTVENVHMTRLYRAGLYVQQTVGSPMQNLNPRGPAHYAGAVSNCAYTSRVQGVGLGYPRPYCNYVYTHWADAICPPSSQSVRQMVDPRTMPGSLSQPPNPYHISYAPVSARDSERQSLSSDARTDDAQSHTDSTHQHVSHTRYPQQHRHHEQSQESHEKSVEHQCRVPSQTVTSTSDISEVTPFTNVLSANVREGPVKMSVPLVTGTDSLMAPFQRSTNVTSTAQTRTNPILEVSSTTDAERARSHQRHMRHRAMRRGLTGWRTSSGGDKSKVLASGAEAGLPTAVGCADPMSLKPPLMVRPGSRPHNNLAERDPHGFFRLLSEKLEKLLKSQLANEHLDRLMCEDEPDYPQTTERLDQTGTRDDRLHAVTIVSEHPATQSGLLPIDTRESSHVQTNRATLSTATTTTPSVLQRPWVDRLLAAARVQHEFSQDNAQAILEDHCSRIWAASADRTPTSSGSGSGGGNGTSFCVEPRGQSDLMSSTSHRKCEPGVHIGNRPPEASDFMNTSQSRTAVKSSSNSRGHSRHRKKRLAAFPRTGASVEADRNRSVHSPLRSVSSSRMTASRAATSTAPMQSDRFLLCSSSDPPPKRGSSRSGLSATTHQLTSKRLLELSKSGHTSAKLSPDATTDNLPTRSMPSTSVSPPLASFVQPASTSDGQLTFTESPFSSSCSPLSSNGAGIDDQKRSAVFSRSSDNSQMLDTALFTTIITNTSSQSTSSSSNTNTTTSAICSSSTCGPNNSFTGGGTPMPLVIGYYLGDDPVPYRSVWPSSSITLGQFKQLIPKKKGLFRYFFKKPSNEFDAGVVHQEITNDNCILPLWEGKVVARVERIE